MRRRQHRKIQYLQWVPTMVMLALLAVVLFIVWETPSDTTFWMNLSGVGFCGFILSMIASWAPCLAGCKPGWCPAYGNAALTGMAVSGAMIIGGIVVGEFLIGGV